MEEKRTIKSTDKIPGCERLTRPEEIKGLSKYLGNIREVQEEWISNNMPEDTETMLGNKLEVQRLPDSVIGLNTDDEKLKPGIERLSVPVEKLKPGKVSLAVDGPSELSQEKEKLNLGPEIKKLDDKKVGIRIEEITNLPESVIGLDAKDTPKLSDFIDTLFVGSTSSLRKDKEELRIDEENKLGNTRIDIRTPEDKLKPAREDINVPENKLRPGIENISVAENELRPGREDIKIPENRLNPDRVDIRVPDDRLNPGRVDIEIPEQKLKDDRINLRVPESYLKGDKIELEAEDKTESFYNSQEDKERATRLDIPKTIMQGSLPVNEIRDGERAFNPEVLKSKFAIDSPSNTAATRALEISSDEYENQWKKFDTEIESKSANELYSDSVKLLLSNPAVFGNMGKELAGVLSAYLGSDSDDGSRAKEGAAKIYSILKSQKILLNDGGEKRETILKSKIKNPDLPERVKYKLSDTTFDSIDTYNPNRYIRYLAELSTDNTVGRIRGKSGQWLRKSVLEATIRTLEYQARKAADKIGASLGRLPGNAEAGAKISNILGGLRETANAINSAKSGNAYSTLSAISRLENDRAANRPSKDDKNGDLGLWPIGGAARDVLEKRKITGEFVSTTEKKTGNLKNEDVLLSTKAEEGGDFEVGMYNTEYEISTTLEDTYGLNINKDYGIGLTLSDLCPNFTGKVYDVSQLKDLLRTSPYITTPYRTIKDLGQARNSATLDTNAYWEVIVEPLCNTRLNGGWSFLPSIAEINKENLVEHGINTAYSKWIPLSNVELQKSKVTSKSLGLFDGEINYPVSVEFTNELRMTVVDDQYKSWRRYFQRCADVSVYYSEAHREDFYEGSEKGQLLAMPTAIDKGKICVAYYKNVTFRIRLYFMTPQYSTIKKFDLLCVMKDFSEEYMGDIDAGSMDLNISFSIVGENPDESKDNELEYSVDTGWNDNKDYISKPNESDTGWLEKFNKLFVREEAADIKSTEGSGSSQGSSTSGNNPPNPTKPTVEEKEELAVKYQQIPAVTSEIEGVGSPLQKKNYPISKSQI